MTTSSLSNMEKILNEIETNPTASSGQTHEVWSNEYEEWINPNDFFYVSTYTTEKVLFEIENAPTASGTIDQEVWSNEYEEWISTSYQ